MDESFGGESDNYIKTDVSLTSSVSVDLAVDANEVVNTDTSSSNFINPKLVPLNIVSLEDFLETNKNVKRFEENNEICPEILLLGWFLTLAPTVSVSLRQWRRQFNILDPLTRMQTSQYLFNWSWRERVAVCRLFQTMELKGRK